jgi:hypothetical protein
VILALDPGNTRSALVALDGLTVVGAWLEPNAAIRARLLGGPWSVEDVLVVEQIQSFGMPAGAELFETCWWSGRFAECWAGPSARLPRRDVKLHLCGTSRAKDGNVRQALLDRYGPGKDVAVGTKAHPGPLYGLKADLWAALAVGVTYHDTHAVAVAS